MSETWKNWAGNQRCAPASIEHPQQVRRRLDPHGVFTNTYLDRVLGKISE